MNANEIGIDVVRAKKCMCMTSEYSGRPELCEQNNKQIIKIGITAIGSSKF